MSRPTSAWLLAGLLACTPSTGSDTDRRVAPGGSSGSVKRPISSTRADASSTPVYTCSARKRTPASAASGPSPQPSTKASDTSGSTWHVNANASSTRRRSDHASQSPQIHASSNTNTPSGGASPCT